jgi:hypothetical protein
MAATPKRRQMLPDDLDVDDLRAKPGAATPQSAFHEAPVSAPAPAEAIGLKEKAVNMSIYLLPADHRRLRMLAAAEETSIQALVMDGIDEVLRRRGQESVSRWEPRRKVR